MRILALALLLAGCGHPLGTIDPELQPYKDTFMSECSERIGYCGGVKYISLTFMPADQPGIAGVCIRYGKDYDITINRTIWKSLSLGSREALVMHEYGHCFLDREHYDGVTQGIPASLMATYVVQGSTYQAHREYYLTELFAR